MNDIENLQKDRNYQEAMDLLNKGEALESLKLFEKTVRENPDHFIAWNNIGFLLYNAKYIDEAEKGFKKALSIEPNYVDAIINLIHLYIKSENMDSAKNYYEKLKSVDPENSEINSLENLLK